MRPVAKGPPPKADYPDYRDALDDLVKQIGLFCSYCEQPISHAPEIEHVQPKHSVPELERSWNNLLLCCKTCNTIKGRRAVDLAQVAMPDRDNTFRGLTYLERGKVKVSRDPTDDQIRLMNQVVGLVRLGRHPDTAIKDDQPFPRDKRAYLRSEVWDLAIRYLSYVERPDRKPLICKCVEDIALSRGFFSVWMTVFRNQSEMLKRFIQAFPGTDTDCFDERGNAVQRPDGRI